MSFILPSVMGEWTCKGSGGLGGNVSENIPFSTSASLVIGQALKHNLIQLLALIQA